MADHSSLGSLLQGISQQPAHLRQDGQLTAQVNGISDVVRGLSRRPGTTLINTTAIPRGMRYLDRELEIEGEIYQLAYTAGQLYIVSKEGILQTIIEEDNALDYIGSDISAYSYDDAIYITNRDKIVELDPTDTSGQDEVITDIGLVMSLGGLFSHTYSIIIEYSDGYKATGNYMAPHGIDDGDAAKTTSKYIMSSLATSLQSGQGITGYTNVEDGVDTPIYTSNNAVRAGTVVTVSGSVMSITGVSDIKITVEDGSGGDTLRKQTAVAKSTEDLVELAPHGTLVKVIGLDDTEDDFWMRFEVDGETTVGASFGSEGLWREWVNAYETVAFDKTTMPHVLTKTGDNEFTLRQGDWQPRRTGDENTNPYPDFVGRSIRDVAGFQSRLVFVSGPHVLMSRTSIPLDWYAQSVVATTATDPVGMLSTAENENNLEWIIAFDRDLVIFGTTAQALVSGSVRFSPSNNSMTETTAFGADLSVRPVSTGRTVLFPFTRGKWSGIKEFYSINTDTANTAVTLTELQKKYMKGNITQIVSSQDFGLTMAITDDPDQRNIVFVNQYIWNGQEKIQDAWHEWVFPYPVVNMFIEDEDIYLLMDTGNGVVQTSMFLDFREEEDLGYSLCLDMYDKDTVTYSDTISSITSDYDNLVIVQGDGCDRPGNTVKYTVTGTGPYTYSFSSDVVPEDAQVFYGIPYETVLTPTMPFIRDKDGKAQRYAKLTVTEFILYFEDSGYISATMSSKYRSEDTVVSNERYVLDIDLDDTDFNGTSSGTFVVPWGERSDWSEFSIKADHVWPVSITEIEWAGQPLTRGRRV